MEIWIHVHKNNLGIKSVLIDTDNIPVHSDIAKHGLCYTGIVARKNIDGFELKVDGINGIRVGDIVKVEDELKHVESFHFATGLVEFKDELTAPIIQVALLSV